LFDPDLEGFLEPIRIGIDECLPRRKVWQADDVPGRTIDDLCPAGGTVGGP